MELSSNARTRRTRRSVIRLESLVTHPVAIKKFKDMIDSRDKLRKIAMREVKMLKEMKHENIVHLKEAFQR